MDCSNCATIFLFFSSGFFFTIASNHDDASDDDPRCGPFKHFLISQNLHETKINEIFYSKMYTKVLSLF